MKFLFFPQLYIFMGLTLLFSQSLFSSEQLNNEHFIEETSASNGLPLVVHDGGFSSEPESKSENILQAITKEPTISYSQTAPVIDGKIDDLWDNVKAHFIDIPFGLESVSYTDSATFKAVWDDNNIYFLVEIPDNNYFNHIDAAVNPWQADLVELYFDVNKVKVDGGGPAAEAGHIQVALNGVNGAGDSGNSFVQFVNEDGTWFNEYAIPFTNLVDEDDVILDPRVMETIGFDITLIDLDTIGTGANETMGRINYNNNTIDAVEGGVAGENWASLDNSANLTFHDPRITKEDTILYSKNAPVIDGKIDELWNDVEAHSIKIPFGLENVSYTNGATFKAIWDTDNMYILVEVPDDNYINHTDAGVNPWQADLVELYFDVNETKIDGGGPSSEDGTESDGHVQVAINSVDGPGDSGNSFGQVVNEDGAWLNEYAIPFSNLVDTNGVALDPSSRKTIGFDITLIDLDAVDAGGNDEAMGRVNYSNNTIDAVEGGVAGESWSTLDNSANLTFINTLGEKPNSGFTASATQVLINDIISFTDTSLYTPTKWFWDFGDNFNSELQNPSHAYTTAGTYTITLVTSNELGTDTLVAKDFITVLDPQAPIADFKTDLSIVPIESSITFTDLSSNNPTEWTWNFGDGYSSNNQNPIHTFTEIGIYTVSLTAKNSFGKTTETKTDFIEITAPLPVADFTASATEITKGEIIEFTDVSENDPTEWAWSFGDGNGTNIQNPVFIYNEAGVYTVTLTVSNSTGTSTETKVDYITVGTNSINSELNKNLTVYPNPSKGLISLAFDKDMGKDVQVEIQDIKGRLIYSSVPVEQNFIEFDLSNEAKGIYIIKIQNDEHTIFKKVILE